MSPLSALRASANGRSHRTERPTTLSMRTTPRTHSVARSLETRSSADDVVAFIQGIWWFSFGDYKLVPESALDIGGVNVANEEFEVPGEFALGQNYPNPFNPSTTIQYNVPAASAVSVQVFDMLGRKVATLVDGQVAAGTHTVSFDARNLASGVYLYRLEAAGNVINRSMMLLK